MRQHGHANEETTVILTAVGIQSPSDAPTRSRQRRNDRHSHRSGNPEPFRCANTVTPTKKRPSFSPQWESRALPMRQHGHGNEDSTRQRAGLPTWTIPQDTHQARCQKWPSIPAATRMTGDNQKTPEPPFLPYSSPYGCGTLAWFGRPEFGLKFGVSSRNIIVLSEVIYERPSRCV